MQLEDTPAYDILWYTEVDPSGNIVRSRFTQDPDTHISPFNRLVKDETPEYDSSTQFVIREIPVLSDSDHVIYQVVNRPAPSPEDAAESVRQERNYRLQVSDWTQLPDVPFTTERRQEWVIYRADLRNVTNQPGFPFIIVWPTEPSGDIN
jgi:hypothetical protein